MQFFRRFSIPILIAILLSIVLTFTVNAISTTGKVIGISDGDTITILRNGRTEKIRLFGVDCPENSQAYGNGAKQFTSSMVVGKPVRIERRNQDKYGRTVANIYIGSRCLNTELVRAGYAWQYREFSKDVAIARLEQNARTAKRGLWADPHPVPPWQYRINARSVQPTVLTQSGSSKPKGNDHKPVIGTVVYHGNTKSRKLHKPGCPGYDCQNCSVEFKSRNAAIDAGYAPCGTCKP
jgi:endonuclease YncB( thermonuclease family)